jgi:hypothetical protein
VLSKKPEEKRWRLKCRCKSQTQFLCTNVQSQPLSLFFSFSLRITYRYLCVLYLILSLTENSRPSCFYLYRSSSIIPLYFGFAMNFTFYIGLLVFTKFVEPCTLFPFASGLHFVVVWCLGVMWCSLLIHFRGVYQCNLSRVYKL